MDPPTCTAVIFSEDSNAKIRGWTDVYWTFGFNGRRFCCVNLDVHRSSHLRNTKYPHTERPTILFFMMYSVYATFITKILSIFLIIKPDFWLTPALPELKSPKIVIKFPTRNRFFILCVCLGVALESYILSATSPVTLSSWFQCILSVF